MTHLVDLQSFLLVFAAIIDQPSQSLGVSCAIHGRVVRVRNKVLRASPEGEVQIIATQATGGSL